MQLTVGFEISTDLPLCSSSMNISNQAYRHIIANLPVLQNDIAPMYLKQDEQSLYGFITLIRCNNQVHVCHFVLDIDQQMGEVLIAHCTDNTTIQS